MEIYSIFALKILSDKSWILLTCFKNVYKFFSVYIIFLTEICAVNLNNKAIDVE